MKIKNGMKIKDFPLISTDEKKSLMVFTICEEGFGLLALATNAVNKVIF